MVAAKKTTTKKVAAGPADWTRRSASAAALRQFDEKYVKTLGHAPVRGRGESRIEVIPTGSIELDCALGIGGYPRGAITQTWGVQDSAKTSLAMLAIAEAQRAYPDQVCGWVNPENMFDPTWAESLGVDLGRLYLEEHPGTAEAAADAYCNLVSSGLCSLVVFDSVGAMASGEEFAKDAGDEVVGRTPKIVTRMVKKCSAIGSMNGTAMLIINQVRSIVGQNFGFNTTTRPGGHALEHATAVRLKLGPGGEEPKRVQLDGENKPIPVSRNFSAKVEKHKFYRPGSVADLWLTNFPTDEFGPIGIDAAPEAATFGLRTGVIEQTAQGRYALPGADPNDPEQRVKAHGREKLVDELRARPDLIALIRERAISSMRSQATVIDSDVDEDDPLGISKIEV